MYIRFGRPMRRHGGFEYCMVNKMRDAFTTIDVIIRPLIEERAAGKVLKQVLEDS